MNRQTQKFKLPMLCVCREEDAILVEHTMKRFFEVLPCNSDELVTYVVRELHWRYGAYVAGLYTDQWCRVVVESIDRAEGTLLPQVQIVVDCDIIEHGLAAAYTFVHDCNYLKPSRYAPFSKEI